MLSPSSCTSSYLIGVEQAQLGGPHRGLQRGPAAAGRVLPVGVAQNAAVGVACEFSATYVRPSRIRLNVLLPAATMPSQAITRSAFAVSTLVV